jgi:hypothetical protein
MGGRKRKRFGAVDQQVDIVQNIAGPHSPDQRLEHVVADLIAQSDSKDQKHNGYSSFFLSKYEEREGQYEDGDTPVVQVGQKGHQEVENDILCLLIEEEK